MTGEAGPWQGPTEMGRLRFTFVVPVLLAGVVGGFIGWTVTRVGCSDAACSALSSLAIGVVSGLVAAAGVGVVVVLADRSLREWREWQRSDNAQRRNNGRAGPDTSVDG